MRSAAGESRREAEWSAAQTPGWCAQQAGKQHTRVMGCVALQAAGTHQPTEQSGAGIASLLTQARYISRFNAVNG